MGFTIKDEEELRSQSAPKHSKKQNDSKADSKEFYTFLQKLNLRTEMGME